MLWFVIKKNLNANHVWKNKSQTVKQQKYQLFSFCIVCDSYAMHAIQLVVLPVAALSIFAFISFSSLLRNATVQSILSHVCSSLRLHSIVVRPRRVAQNGRVFRKQTFPRPIKKKLLLAGYWTFRSKLLRSMRWTETFYRVSEPGLIPGYWRIVEYLLDITVQMFYLDVPQILHLYDKYLLITKIFYNKR